MTLLKERPRPPEKTTMTSKKAAKAVRISLTGAFAASNQSNQLFIQFLFIVMTIVRFVKTRIYKGISLIPFQYIDALELVKRQTPSSLRRVKSPCSRQLLFLPPYTAATTRLRPVIDALSPLISTSILSCSAE